VLDFDGTLVRSDRVHADAFRTVLADHGVVEFEYAEFAGWRTREVFEEVFRRHGIAAPTSSLAAAVQRKQALARARLSVAPELVEGAAEFVATAAAAGLRLAVATSASRQGVEAALRGAGLRSFLEVVVTGDDVPLAKPAPDVWLEALRRLGIAAARAVAVEDSETGIVSARAAGLDVVLLRDKDTGKLGPVSATVPSATFAELTAALVRSRDLRPSAGEPGPIPRDSRSR
jgi:HAD superfamily hydrolase (TIGR01509 family)